MNKFSIRLVFVLITITFCFLGIQKTFEFGGYQQFASEPGIIPEGWSGQELNELSAIVKIALLLTLCSFTILGYRLTQKFQVKSVLNTLIDIAGISIALAFGGTLLIRLVPFDFFTITNIQPNYRPSFNQVLGSIFHLSLLSFFLGSTIWLLEEGSNSKTKFSSFKISSTRIWLSLFLLYAVLVIVLILTVSGEIDSRWFASWAFTNFIQVILIAICCTICSWAYFFIFTTKESTASFKRWVFYAVFAIGLFGWFFTLYCISNSFDIILIGGFDRFNQWFLGLIFVLVIAAICTIVRRFNWFGFQDARNLTEKSAELSMLKSQINPHFLFNSLNSLYGISIEEQSPKTAEGIQKLSEMMRFMLKENTEDQISISKEINHINNYIDLQRLRVDENEHVNIETSIAKACQGEITPMLLIPFIENAFKHGISLNAASWIKIDLDCQTDFISLEVKNSIHQKSFNKDDESGIGLENVRERLKMLYPNRYELDIRSDEKEYFVHLKLQLK